MIKNRTKEEFQHQQFVTFGATKEYFLEKETLALIQETRLTRNWHDLTESSDCSLICRTILDCVALMQLNMVPAYKKDIDKCYLQPLEILQGKSQISSIKSQSNQNAGGEQIHTNEAEE